MGRREGRRGDFKPEIQALRAIAIVSVVVYHLWPGRLSGGYLGVDVFFVISGYLITSHLLRDSADGRLDLPRFWARRIRRLLPASLTVLLAVAVTVIVIVPERLWKQFLSEIIASTIYLQNWFLASNSVDYLAADNSPSPVQHFWSLSAEEQFYIAWPVLIAATLLVWRLARRRTTDTDSSPRRALFIVLVIVTGASLAWAIHSTAVDPAPAFFATTTRAWEFGAGALLAFAPAALLHGRITPAIRSLFGWAGWITIVACVALFTDNTVHPGILTVIPVIGVILVIWAGAPESVLSPAPLARLVPVQFVGNISYSLYLWHWPLIVLVPLISGSPLTTVSKIVIIIVATLLALASYTFIEKPTLRLPLTFRTVRPTTRPWFAAALVAAILLTAVPLSSIMLQQANSAQDLARATALAKQDGTCFGAAAMVNAKECSTQPAPAFFVPSTSAADTDIDARLAGCGAADIDVVTTPCRYTGGNGRGLNVVMAGDSHTAHLAPLVLALADKFDWTVTIAVKDGCPFMDAYRTNDPAIVASCRRWNPSLLKFIQDTRFDLVVTSQLSAASVTRADGLSNDETLTAGLTSTWKSITATGARILAIKDDPRPLRDPQACLDTYGPNKSARCAVTTAKAARFDAQVVAAKAFTSDEVHVVSFDDLYCAHGKCPAVIGGVNVYRDQSHLTATFVRTMAPFAAARIPAKYLKR